MQTCSLRDLNSFLRGKFEKKLYQEPGAHQLFVRICICICIWARTSLKPIYIFKSEHRHLPYNFSTFPRDTFFRILEGPCEQTPPRSPQVLMVPFYLVPRAFSSTISKWLILPPVPARHFGAEKRTAFAVMDAKWSKLYALFFFISLYETTSQV